jgi:hypothetical protein
VDILFALAAEAIPVEDDAEEEQENELEVESFSSRAMRWFSAGNY